MWGEKFIELHSYNSLNVIRNYSVGYQGAEPYVIGRYSQRYIFIMIYNSHLIIIKVE